MASAAAHLVPRFLLVPKNAQPKDYVMFSRREAVVS